MYIFWTECLTSKSHAFDSISLKSGLLYSSACKYLNLTIYKLRYNNTK